MALNDLQQQQLLKLLPQYKGMRYAPDWQLGQAFQNWGQQLGADPTEVRQYLNDKLLGDDFATAKGMVSNTVFGQPQTVPGAVAGGQLGPKISAAGAGGLMPQLAQGSPLAPQLVSGAQAGGPIGGPADNGKSLLDYWNDAANYRPDTPAGRAAYAMVNIPGAVNALGRLYKENVMDPLARARHWAFTPDAQYAQETQGAPQAGAAPALPPGGLFGQGITPGVFTIPGQNINYFQGLPQVGLKRAEPPAAPDYTEVEQAMAAAAPQIGSESRTTGSDIWLNMLPGFLAGLANPGQNFGQTLAGAAAGAATGALRHGQQMKAEGREDEEKQQRYMQWLTANKMHMTSSRYNAAMQRAQMEQGVNNTEAQLSAQNQAMRYEAGIKQAQQFQPQISGDNLITRSPETGEITVKNINPQSGLYTSLLGAGALPANAYSMKSVLANLPPEAVAGLQPFISKIQSSPEFMGLVSGQGGAAQADVALLSQLIAQLKQAGQTEALQAVYQAMAKSALMSKLSVK